jgi:hypothetical protein
MLDKPPQTLYRTTEPFYLSYEVDLLFNTICKYVDVTKSKNKHDNTMGLFGLLPKTPQRA